jgi:hypothetical protein
MTHVRTPETAGLRWRSLRLVAWVLPGVAVLAGGVPAGGVMATTGWGTGDGPLAGGSPDRSAARRVRCLRSQAVRMPRLELRSLRRSCLPTAAAAMPTRVRPGSGFGSESVMTCFHAEATCLGSGPVV